MNRERWPVSFDPTTGIAFAEAGRGPVVLLLHGLFDTSYSWHRLFPLLSADAHLVAPDLPGFGRSPLPDRWGETVGELVDRLLRFSDRWKGEKVVLVGSSMGGGLGLALTVAAPDRFDRIVLLNPYAGPSVPAAVAAAKRPVIAALIPLLSGWPLRSMLIRTVFSRSLYDRRHLTKEYVEELGRALRSFSRRRGMVRFLRQVDPKVIKELERHLPNVRQEVLLFWGEDDRWLPADGAGRLQARLTLCRRINFSGCGHLPQLERPEEIAGAIRGILRGAHSP